MSIEFQNKMKSEGYTVVSGYRYLIWECDGIVHGRKTTINPSGNKSLGEPIDNGPNSVTYIPGDKSHKVWHGNSKASILAKLTGDPDFEKTAAEIAAERFPK